jgi:hypothetical protein
MNIIIHGFHAPEDINVLKRVIARCNVKHLVHICAPPNILDSKELGIPIESIAFNQAGNGLYHLKDLPALEQPLLEKMLPTESVVLKQMDRLEVYDSKYTHYSNRRNLYLRHLRFWNHIITSRKINLFIGSNIPHEVYDYVIYGLCQNYGIRTHFLFQSAIPDTLHPLRNLNDFTPGLLPAFDRLVELYRELPDDKIVLPDTLQREWNRQITNNIPFYMDQPVRDHPGNAFLEHEYNSVIQKPNLEAPYVYFPLHYQPEITTNPLGGQFCDQATAIAMLSQHLPKSIRLIVKEHPMQNWVGRGNGFYQNILEQCPNVTFVPKGTSSHNLIEKSVAVATITGTAGWEALFRKKPVLLFGTIFYQNAPGVFKVASNESCNNAINSVLDRGFIYNERLLKLFLIALESISVNSIIDAAYRTDSQLDPLVSENNLVIHLSKIIDDPNMLD